jgi:ATP-dependent helicase/DNAse subunit B
MIVSYGPFQPSLEDAFVNRVRELMRSPTRPICVVAPSRRIADRLERLLSVENGQPLFNVHFHTFYSLAWAIVEESGLPKGEFISDSSFYHRIVDLLVDEIPEFAALFEKSMRPKALAESLRSSLRDLLDAGVLSDNVREHFNEDLVLRFGRKISLSALLNLSELYLKKLLNLGVFSVGDIVRLAAERAENSSFLKNFNEIIYYGFYDLTGLQLDFFERVVKAHSCHLFFPYRRNHPAFRFAKDFFEQKLGGYDSVELDCDSSELALGPALERLFASTNETAVVLANAILPTKLRFTSVSGVHDEVWFAAKEILSLVETEGFLFEEIGIVARSLDSYRDAVLRVLPDNAIPFDMKSSAPLIRRPLVKTMLNLFNVRRRDFPVSMVEDITTSPYFIAGSEPREIWKARVRQIVGLLGIGGGWMQWEGRLGECVDKKSADFDGLPIEEASKLWGILLSWEKNLASCPDSWASFSQKSLEMMDKFLALPEGYSPIEAETWGMLREALQSLTLFDKIGPPKDFADCVDAFEEKIRRASIETSSGIRGVRILDAMAARGESFRALFLLGLNEGSFPRQIVEDPLLRDDIRSFLRHPAGYWIRPKKEGYEEEKLLFYLMAASAKERLYCVYSRSNEEGEAQIPSLYLHELARAAGVSFSDAETLRIPRGPAEKLELCPPESLSPTEISLRSILDDQDAIPYLKAIQSPKAKLLAVGLNAALELNSWGEAGPRDGLVQVPLEFLKRWEKKISASAIETYATCPFRFFAERVLGFKERNPANAKGELQTSIVGQIYHDILRRFYSDMPNDFWNHELASYHKFFDAAIEACFKEHHQGRLGIYPLLWLSIKETAAERLGRFLEWDLRELRASAFRPAEFELEIGAELPESKNYRLYGILDRVDKSFDGNRLRVVDYKKSWSPSFRFQGEAGLSNLISKGEFFQLPFYLELLSQEKADASLEGAFLYGIEESGKASGFPTSHPYTFAEWKKQREDFFKGVSVILEKITAGHFPINPSDGEFGHCSHCDFPNLCRKNHAPSRRRAAGLLSKTGIVRHEDAK